MGRIKGIKNQNTDSKPIISSLPPQERIRLLANLIVDKILEDKRNGNILLNTFNSQ